MDYRELNHFETLNLVRPLWRLPLEREKTLSFEIWAPALGELLELPSAKSKVYESPLHNQEISLKETMA